MTIHIDAPGNRQDETNKNEDSVETVSSAFEGTIEQNQIRISLVPSKRKKTKKINMVIEGDFNIRNAALVKENCQKLLHHFDMVSITLRNISEIDLAAVQLLHVLSTTPALSQKTITIESELSKEERLLIENAGLKEVLTKQQQINK